MNNATTAEKPLRASEGADVLTLQILGLIAREGSGQFAPTEKAGRLRTAIERQKAGEPLSSEELALLAECGVSH